MTLRSTARAIALASETPSKRALPHDFAALTAIFPRVLDFNPKQSVFSGDQPVRYFPAHAVDWCMARLNFVFCPNS